MSVPYEIYPLLRPASEGTTTVVPYQPLYSFIQISSRWLWGGQDTRPTEKGYCWVSRFPIQLNLRANKEKSKMKPKRVAVLANLVYENVNQKNHLYLNLSISRAY